MTGEHVADENVTQGGTASAPRGIVLVLHGGQSKSTAPVSPRQLAVLRMVPVAAAIKRAAGPDGIDVQRPLFALRGWNGDKASPVADLTRLLDETAARHPGVPVVLVGHSMGARAALRAAGHPAVTAIAGLAPWLPPGEPVGQLTGRRVLLAHGTRDTTTSAAETWAYAEHARPLCDLTAIEVGGADHPMLRRAPLWHELAAAFTRLAFGLRSGIGPGAVAIAAAAGRTGLVTLE
jgi:pimeloyl-ACP methyl ester carboxylesterase